MIQKYSKATVQVDRRHHHHQKKFIRSFRCKKKTDINETNWWKYKVLLKSEASTLLLFQKCLSRSDLFINIYLQESKCIAMFLTDDISDTDANPAIENISPSSYFINQYSLVSRLLISLLGSVFCCSAMFDVHVITPSYSTIQYLLLWYIIIYILS